MIDVRDRSRRVERRQAARWRWRRPVGRHARLAAAPARRRVQGQRGQLRRPPAARLPAGRAAAQADRRGAQGRARGEAGNGQRGASFLAPLSSATVWIAQPSGSSVPIVHIAVQGIGNRATDEGKAALEAARKVAAGGDPATEFASLGVELRQLADGVRLSHARGRSGPGQPGRQRHRCADDRGRDRLRDRPGSDAARRSPTTSA